MIDNKVVGQAISKLRQSENMTQQTLAACLNVSHQAVSKWENGAALPDVLLLLEISRMFGVTLEQLIAGDIEHRLERNAGQPVKEKQPEGIKLTLGDENEKDIEAAVEDVEKSVEDAMKDADTEAEQSEPVEDLKEDDIDKIIGMAPFMSRAVLDEMVTKYSGQMTPRQLAKLAPFVSSDTLEKLIVNNTGEVNWDTLRRLAPFLKKEVVDGITLAIAKGEKYIKPAAKQVKRSSEDIGKTVSRGMEKLKHFAQKIGESLNGDSFNIHVVAGTEDAKPESPKKRGVSEARKRIFERALADEKWDWMAEHMEQLDDADMKREIALKARQAGMEAWAREHLGEDFDEKTAEDAIIAGDWVWLGEHISDIEGDMHDLVIATALDENRWDWIIENFDELDVNKDEAAAIADCAIKNERWDWLYENYDELSLNSERARALAEHAANAGDWEWLSENFDDLDIDDATDFALRAYDAGETDAAMTFAEEIDDSDTYMKLADKAIAKGDYDFVGGLVENGDEEFVSAICLKIANAGDIKRAAEYAEDADEDALVELIDIATKAGDWDAIEKLNEYLD